MISTIETAYPGYHVPTKTEYDTLNIFIAGSPGGKIKEVGTAHWLTPNSGAVDIYEFTALPGGKYVTNYSNLTTQAHFMTKTEFDASNIYYMLLEYNTDGLQISAHRKIDYMSVRLIKD
jgi:uncharacterized protein (TIGR02145 family)